MPTYIYKARDKTGMLITGEVDAADQKEIALSLNSLGYKVISIERQKGIRVILAKLFYNVFRKIKEEDVITSMRQLSAMMHSGLPITEALDSVREQTKNPSFQKIWSEMIDDIRGGKSLSETFEKYPALFSPFCVSMIKVGETAGILDQTLDRIAVIGLEEIALKNKLKSAMVYPILLVFLSLGIVTFILTVILPKFVSIFEESGATLPVPTLILLSISGFLRSYWYIGVIAIIAAAVAISRYVKSEKGRYNVHSKILKMPLIGGLMLKISMTRLFRTLGEMLRSGIPLVYGLQIVQGVTNNMVVKRLLAHIKDAVSSGASLTSSAKVSGIFPPMVIQMINAGEKTGSLEEMFIQIGEFYDRETTLMINTVTSLIEPLLLLVMGGFVGFLALSVLLPIFNLVRVLKK